MTKIRAKVVCGRDSVRFSRFMSTLYIELTPAPPAAALNGVLGDGAALTYGNGMRKRSRVPLIGQDTDRYLQ